MINEKEQRESTGTAYFAKLQYEQTTLYKGKRRFELDLGVSEDEAKELREKGLIVKEADGNHKEPYIKFRPDTYNSYFDRVNKFLPCVDDEGTPVKGVVPNGSRVTAYYQLRPYTTPQGVKGVTADLRRVVVHEMAEIPESYKAEDARLKGEVLTNLDAG